MRGAVANELFTTVRAVKMDDCKVLIGAPCRTRTCDLLVRSQTLYPTELRALSDRTDHKVYHDESWPSVRADGMGQLASLGICLANKQLTAQEFLSDLVFGGCRRRESATRCR
jgi:hypothetical protein